MLKIENTDVCGWESAIRGMRNPMNSWDKSDSFYCEDCYGGLCEHDFNGDCPVSDINKFVIGYNDLDLMMRLAKGGAVHAKYRRMITVYVDITAPLYWWKEFDTYKVGTVANSCSTMHKIHDREFGVDDFSCEHLLPGAKETLYHIVDRLNYWRTYYLSIKEQKVPGSDAKAKEIWWQMIQLLPSSYNQKRTVMLNYEVLVGMYRDRKNHKLDEWHTFCDWIESLPYSELITMESEGNQCQS